MILVTWMIDIDSNTEYLECRNREDGKEPDVVKVHFHSRFDVDTIKGLKLEGSIAKAIFSNRSKYGSNVDAYLEVYPNTIHFRTGTDVQIYNEQWPINRE